MSPWVRHPVPDGEESGTGCLTYVEFLKGTVPFSSNENWDSPRYSSLPLTIVNSIDDCPTLWLFRSSMVNCSVCLPL